MKNAILTTILSGILLLMGSFSTENNDPCETGAWMRVAISKLPEDYNFLRSYKIDNENGTKQKLEYSYVFTNGTRYVINLCESNTEKSFISILDRDRNKIASTDSQGQITSATELSCNATGIYYIVYTFNDSSSHCGASSLGFKR